MQITPPPMHHRGSGERWPLTWPAADQAATVTAARSLLVLGAPPAPAEPHGPAVAACPAHSGTVPAQSRPP